MHDLDTIRAKIAVDFAAIHESLHSIAVPAGYQWEACPSELTWFVGDIVASTRHGASVFLRRVLRDHHDARQAHIEIRLFWSENSDPKPRAGAMRATLWAEHGERIGFQSQSLLAAPATFISADDRDDLVRALRTRIEAVLDSYRTLDA